MIQIEKATFEQAELLSTLSKTSFLISHGHSAPKEDIENYISTHFTPKNFVEELKNPANEYYLIYDKNTIAGFSKVIFNLENKNIAATNVTKMERLYLLEEFYGLGLGKELFDFNVALAKQNNQAGIWLAVWVENTRALSFYKKKGI